MQNLVKNLKEREYFDFLGRDAVIIKVTWRWMQQIPPKRW
jgi:hypothetical protein